MKDHYLATYLLSLAILVLILYDTTFLHSAIKLIPDKTRLGLYFEGKHEFIDDIIIINSMDYPEDTIQKWTRRILDFKPRVLAIDIYYDSTSNLKRDTLVSTIVLPAFSENGVDVDFTVNYFSKQQQYGSVEHYDDIRLRKFFDYGGVILPSFSLQTVKLYDSLIYKKAVLQNDDELINFSNINMIVEYPDDYSDEHWNHW